MSRIVAEVLYHRYPGFGTSCFDEYVAVTLFIPLL